MDLLFNVLRAESGTEVAVPESASTAEVPQQPLYYPEDEEEEIYISESLQEITDGTFSLQH